VRVALNVAGSQLGKEGMWKRKRRTDVMYNGKAKRENVQF
jgi:hypothetical protein